MIQEAHESLQKVAETFFYVDVIVLRINYINDASFKGEDT